MATKKELTAKLKHYFGFDTFKGDQEAIIQNLLAGNNTFVLMPTGGGKSLCYQLPSLIMDGTAIVISPLIALMKNQVDVINGLSEEEGLAHYLNSSLNKAAIQQVMDDVRQGRTKLLYVAPESLTKDENVEFLKDVKVSFYAIDVSLNGDTTSGQNTVTSGPSSTASAMRPSSHLLPRPRTRYAPTLRKASASPTHSNSRVPSTGLTYTTKYGRRQRKSTSRSYASSGNTKAKVASSTASPEKK